MITLKKLAGFVFGVQVLIVSNIQAAALNCNKELLGIHTYDELSPTDNNQIVKKTISFPVKQWSIHGEFESLGYKALEGEFSNYESYKLVLRIPSIKGLDEKKALKDVSKNFKSSEHEFKGDVSLKAVVAQNLDVAKAIREVMGSVQPKFFYLEIVNKKTSKMLCRKKIAVELGH